MKKRLAVSLYYRLFLVFGLSFLLIIATLLLTNRTEDFWINISGLGLVILILITNGFLIRKLLAPIARIQDSAKELGLGNFDRRVDIEFDDEIGEMARTFNLMAHQIQSQVEALKQMAVGVSHEIRSPLARMKLVTESINDEKQKRLLNNEITNIDRIVEMTIEREALENGLSRLLLQPVELTELLKELSDYYSESGERVTVEVPKQSVDIVADRRRLEMLLKNILDNCFEHGRSDSPPCVKLVVENKTTTLSISDKGSGLPTTEGNQGLGLRLCASIARAHGMSFHLLPNEGGGTKVILTWRTFAS